MVIKSERVEQEDRYIRVKTLVCIFWELIPIFIGFKMIVTIRIE